MMIDKFLTPLSHIINIKMYKGRLKSGREKDEIAASTDEPIKKYFK